MGKVDDRDIYEIKRWLNDDKQNVDRLNAIVNGGGSDITVEAVTFTENGTFTAPSGKAYSPVTVNVPGGSSDFSTATVRLVNTGDVSTTGTTLENVPYILDDNFVIYNVVAGRDNGGVANVDVVLYKGSKKLYIIADESTLSIDGNASYDENEGSITITGNCTISADGQ